MSRCLTDEDLERLARDAGPGGPGSAVREHLADCPRCRQRLADEASGAALLVELRGLVRPAPGGPDVPGYRRIEECSRGGQGVVWKAVQESTNRTVALKVMRGADLRAARARRRFEREIDLATRLRHPGIARVLDSGRTDGVPWLAREWVDGETLDVHVNRQDPARPERLRLFRELCVAVAHAHRSGVLHRDLKPENVLVDATGRVRVLDFGTAVGLDGPATDRVTAPDEFLGTLAYAAPEQLAPARGPRALDTRTDVWALGVILYELLTGHLPFDGPDRRESTTRGGLARLIERVLEHDPTPPQHWVRGLDRDLVAILGGALAKDPERRYPSVEALVRDLDHHAASEPLEVRPRSLGRSLVKALRRRRREVLLATVLLGLTGAAVGTVLRERWRTERARADAALVKTVVADLLRPDGTRAMADDARLREALAMAAREIEGNLADAPDAQAALELTLGDTYRRLHLVEEAEPHLRAALTRLRTAGDPLEIARALDGLGLVLAERNRPEALGLLTEALDLRRAILQEDDPRVAESERSLAFACLRQFQGDDRERAGELLEQALARFERALGPDDPQVAETCGLLARVRPVAEAEALYRRALAILDRGDGPQDPRLVEMLADYAGLLQYKGDLEHAEALLRRAASETERLYGAELGFEMLRRLSSVRLERGDPAGAEELARRAIVLELESWARRRPGDADALRSVVAGLESFEAPGEPPYAEALAWLLRFRGSGAFELTRLANHLTAVLRAQGRQAAAEPLLREALGVGCRAWGADCPIRGNTLERLAELLIELDRGTEARPMIEEGLRLARVHEDDEARSRLDTLLETCCQEPE
jgi:tetratricopeptide (TPR) repeat protein